VAALAVLGVLTAPATAAPEPPAIEWTPCPDRDPLEKGRLKGLDCGTLTVPLDHERPDGRKITLALTRARHTAPDFQGVALLNRGGPGAHGRDLAAVFAAGMAPTVAAAYDWIGFDPRGVGASQPALTCDETYQNPGRPRADTVPGSAAEEHAWRERARAFAEDCGARHGPLLAHMGTESLVRDMEAVRVALGQQQINYFGYSYGSYLGAAYATRYPARVRRMVLDSVVRPSGVWYDNNLDQNQAFEHRIQTYFAWIARHDRVLRLGDTRAAVAGAYDRVRAALATTPIHGRVGPSELDDLFLSNGYGDHTWVTHARALSAFVVRGDGRPLAALWGAPTWLDQNNYAVYEAVQCRDAEWPRDWDRWHHDNWRLYRAGYRFETWGNAWYNAPCAFWPVPGGPRPPIQGSSELAPILLVQATEDAATPFRGAVETHGRFPGSRLLVQVGGGNHGVTGDGDRCVEATVADYLGEGKLPPARPGPDARCAAGGPPRLDHPSDARRTITREPVATRGSLTS
jgi:pimeloyl-ACP methyl ester carboxylesterase